MNYLEFIFMVILVMTAIYAIFNYKDFLKSWGAWILLLIKGIWNGIKWAWNKIISIFKKEGN